MNVETLIEEAGMNVWDVADLYSWSLNYEAGRGPFTLFLDLVGWSDEHYGETFYDLSNMSLGYVEIDKLGRALMQYALNPRDVREYIDALMEAEGEE